MEVTLNIVNAFTRNGSGGNPAAVVLQADGLTHEQKQQLAAENGLSETAFVSASDKADFKLDFYTPSRQIAHCGHATIATFAFLKQMGQIDSKLQSSKETVDGVREIKFAGDEVFMEQRLPEYTALNPDDRKIAIHALGIADQCLVKGMDIVNTGNSFLVLEVTDEQTLAGLRPDFSLISLLSDKYGLIGYYVFCTQVDALTDATTRMFAPAYGIDEESATGMAAGPLACYLHRNGIVKTDYLFEQGRFMKVPSPSLIKVHITATDGMINGVLAGGTATQMSTWNHQL